MVKDKYLKNPCRVETVETVETEDRVRTVIPCDDCGVRMCEVNFKLQITPSCREHPGDKRKHATRCASRRFGFTPSPYLQKEQLVYIE